MSDFNTRERLFEDDAPEWMRVSFEEGVGWFIALVAASLTLLMLWAVMS